MPTAYRLLGRHGLMSRIVILGENETHPIRSSINDRVGLYRRIISKAVFLFLYPTINTCYRDCWCRVTIWRVNIFLFPLIIGHTRRNLNSIPVLILSPALQTCKLLIAEIRDGGRAAERVHGRVVRAGLCLCEVEHLAVQSRTALAGAAVEGRYEPVTLYPGFVVRICLRSVRDVRALSPDDSPGAERVNSELLLEYPRGLFAGTPRQHTDEKLAFEPSRHAAYVLPDTLRVIRAAPVGAQNPVNVLPGELREAESQPSAFLNAEYFVVVAVLRDIPQR